MLIGYWLVQKNIHKEQQTKTEEKCPLDRSRRRGGGNRYQPDYKRGYETRLVR